jgi:hypothetical protein
MIGKYTDGSGHGLIEVISQNLPGGTEKNPRKNFSQDSGCPDRYLNPIPSEYEPRVHGYKIILVA